MESSEADGGHHEHTHSHTELQTHILLVQQDWRALGSVVLLLFHYCECEIFNQANTSICLLSTVAGYGAFGTPPPPPPPSLRPVHQDCNRSTCQLSLSGNYNLCRLYTVCALQCIFHWWWWTLCTIRTAASADVAISATPVQCFCFCTAVPVPVSKSIISRVLSYSLSLSLSLSLFSVEFHYQF